MNSYHYVGGNLLSKRDLLGLEYLLTGGQAQDADNPNTPPVVIANAEARERAWADWNNGLSQNERALFQLDVLADGRGRITGSDAGRQMLAACAADPAGCAVRTGVLRSLRVAESQTQRVHIMPVPIYNDPANPAIEGNWNGAQGAPRIRYSLNGANGTVVEWLGIQGNQINLGRTSPAGAAAVDANGASEEIVIYSARFNGAPLDGDRRRQHTIARNVTNPRLRVMGGETYQQWVDRAAPIILRHEIETHADRHVPGHAGPWDEEAERNARRNYLQHQQAGTLL